MEIEQLRKYAYDFEDAREIVGIFEEKLAKYAGSRYAAVLDCASHGIFLSLKYKNVQGVVEIPRNTYVSVPMQIHHAGAKVRLRSIDWSGIYQIGNTGIYDSSARFTRNMFLGGRETLQILSFQIKKRLPIGRGGAVLTNSRQAYEWIKLASYDGRDLNSPYDSQNHVVSLGWHMYMTPEDAARGILLMDKLGNNHFPDIADSNSYPDLSNWLKKIGLI